MDQPTGTTGLAAHLMTAYATNTHILRDLVEKLNAEAVQIVATDVTEGVVYEANGVTVTAFLVDHAPVKPALGYRVDYGGRSVVISGDTRPSDNLVNYAKGVDLLIHEVFLAGSTAATAQYHTLPEQAADVFTRAAPRLALYSHILLNQGNPSDPIARTQAAGYHGPLYVGRNLTSVTVGDEVTVSPCLSTATPEIKAVTNDSYGATLSAPGTIIAWGTGFSAEGGNSLRFVRIGAGADVSQVALDESTRLLFWKQSSSQINAALGGRVAAGHWNLTVRSACGVSSAAFAITVQ